MNYVFVKYYLAERRMMQDAMYYVCYQHTSTTYLNTSFQLIRGDLFSDLNLFIVFSYLVPTPKIFN